MKNHNIPFLTSLLGQQHKGKQKTTFIIRLPHFLFSYCHIRLKGYSHILTIWAIMEGGSRWLS